MNRRYFEHIYIELCLAANRRLSRYDLWLLVWESGNDPDDMTGAHAAHFVEHDLSGVLEEEGVRLGKRARRRLEKSILRFDPHRPTPEEWLERCFERSDQAA